MKSRDFGSHQPLRPVKNLPRNSVRFGPASKSPWISRTVSATSLAQQVRSALFPSAVESCHFDTSTRSLGEL